MNISVCIECGVRQNSPWYIFRLCSHSICQICYDRLSEESGGTVCLHSFCMKCLTDDVDVNETDYNQECPSCYINYRASATTISEHNCLDDEGVFDV